MSASPVTPEAFRRAFRSWPSGVAVLTCARGSELHGMTVSSLTSVSLEPPLVGVCCDLKSHTLHLLRDVGKFAVTVLAAHQRELSIRFAAPEFEAVRFEGQTYTLGNNGCPLLDGGLVFFECSVMSRVPAGDHELVLGSVDRVSSVEGEPLAYWAGSYRSLTT